MSADGLLVAATLRSWRPRPSDQRNRWLGRVSSIGVKPTLLARALPRERSRADSSTGMRAFVAARRRPACRCRGPHSAGFRVHAGQRGSESPDRGGRPDHRHRRRLGDVLCRQRRGRRPAAAPARRGPPLVVRGSCDPDRGHLHRLSGSAHDLDQLLRPHFTRVRGPCELRFHHHRRGHAAGAPQHLALGGAGAVVLGAAGAADRGPDRPYRAGRGAHRQGAHLPCYGDIFCRRQRDLALRE